jgi:phosphoribosylformimino-5-aminoimidazole carboxamide ribotide isomerase
MLVIPAIDLYQGNVVRLTRGDPKDSKIYSNDPVAIAKQWESQGAKLLHLVDLSAALGEGNNMSAIKDILKAVKIKVELGGGIRDLNKAKELIKLGVDKIIIGTRVLDEDFLNSLIKELGVDKIAAGVDVIDSFIAVEGWKKKTDFNGLEFVAYLGLKGIKRIIYTDISRDGTLEGVNLEGINKLSVFKELDIILSGGVASLDDFKRVKKEASFVWGLIVGKALYEGKFKLSQALEI